MGRLRFNKALLWALTAQKSSGPFTAQQAPTGILRTGGWLGQRQMGPPDSNASSQSLSLQGEALSRPSITFHHFCSLCDCPHLPEVMESGWGKEEPSGAKSKFLQKRGLLELQETSESPHPTLIFPLGKLRSFRINRFKVRSLGTPKLFLSLPLPSPLFPPSYRGWG